MPTWTAKPTPRKTIAVALQGITCLLLLLSTFSGSVLALPPEVKDDEFSVWEDSDDSENQLDVLANDDPLPNMPFVIVGVIPGEHGEVRIIGRGALVTYQPDPDFYGTDAFTYTVDDGSGGNPSATVRITVKAINDPPSAGDDFETTQEDEPVTIKVLNNDEDPDGKLDTGSVQRIAGPSNGRVAVDDTTGDITYRPNDNWHGQDIFSYAVCDDGSPPPVLCDQANVYITVTPVSDLPIADAGPDQSAPTLSTVTLDGSGSYDPDGDVELTYLWQQVQPWVQPVTLSDSKAESPTFVAPDNPEVLVFSLRVFDNNGDASQVPDTVRITVTNQTPIADAGPDQRVPTESVVTLDGSGSYDPDHDGLTFEWLQTGGPTVSLSSKTAVSPTFTAPAEAAQLVFSLRVRDGFGARSIADQTIVDVYEPPIFNLYMPFVVSNQATMPDLVVQSISATRNNIQVVIKNQGSASVTRGFYVDVYVDPLRAPVSANEGWDTPGIKRNYGLVWAIEIGQATNHTQGILAPLLPGGTLTLNVNDGFYRPNYSSMSWPLAVGTRIYAQVDSYPDTSPHDGLVIEIHEYYDQAYNNITGPVYSTGAASSPAPPDIGTNTSQTGGTLRPRP